MKFVCGILLIVIGACVSFSDSRAAWFSVIIPILIYVVSGISGKKYRHACYMLGVAILLGLSTGLFHYKKKSAEARLMIWEITLSSISDHILIGKGASSFAAEYMYRQAAFLRYIRIRTGYTLPQITLMHSMSFCGFYMNRASLDGLYL